MKLSLRSVSPQTFAICLGYGIINLLLGVGLAAFYQTNVPIAVANLLTYPEWGILFFVTGVLTLIGLSVNNWQMVRQTQLLGLLIKSIWLIALIIRSFIDPATAIITIVWLFLAYIQAVVYIFFPRQTGDIVKL